VAIIFEKPDTQIPKNSGTRVSKNSSERPVYQKEARAPRGRKAVYVDVLTEARLVQAAAELQKNKDDMANQAVEELLRREAAQLFDREFAEANEHSRFAIHRHEFAESWRPPAWMREPK
jgi:hypothetical protein